MSHICSPLRYPGGKNCIFPFVSKIFYENKLIGVDYAEPFAGGAGLALRLLFEEYVDRIYINDYDRSIYSFWWAVVNKPDEFCSWLSDVSVSVDNWRLYKSVQTCSDRADLFELAKSTFFLNRTNVSGVLKGGVIGGLSQAGKFKIDARFGKDGLIQRIQRIAKYKKRIFVSGVDGLAFVRKLDKRGRVFLYLDPPYVKKGSGLYMNYFSKFDHERLAAAVKELASPWMVSYDNNDYILDIYSGQRKLLYKLSQSASNRVGDEVLIFKDDIVFDESSRFLKSPVEI